MRVIRDLLLLEPKGQGTDIGGAVDYLMKMLPNRAIVFLLSDFVDSGAERPLKLLAQRHDLLGSVSGFGRRQSDTLEEELEPSLPVTVLSDCHQAGVVLEVIRFEVVTEIEERSMHDPAMDQ